MCWGRITVIQETFYALQHLVLTARTRLVSPDHLLHVSGWVEPLWSTSNVHVKNYTCIHLMSVWELGPWNIEYKLCLLLYIHWILHMYKYMHAQIKIYILACMYIMCMTFHKWIRFNDFTYLLYFLQWVQELTNNDQDALLCPKHNLFSMVIVVCLQHLFVLPWRSCADNITASP